MIYRLGKLEGGFMDVIRCDEQEYLVWKWSPHGIADTTRKENAIRYGSSLRVKDGELAVFFYQQNNGTIQDFIKGPHDQTIKTANFPVLTGIVGSAFGGKSPFQAEIYYINLSENVQIRFGVPWFDVFDQRFPDLGVPCAVRGTITFNITDYKNFIKLNRLINFSLDDFKKQIQDATAKKLKQIVINIPIETGLPAMQMERKISEINDYVKPMLSTILADDFGVNLKRLDIGAVELDKEHPHYQQLKLSTVDQQTKLIDATTDIEIKKRHLKVETEFLPTHQINLQADVAKTAAESLGKLGGGSGGDGGLNAAGLVAGAMVGGAVGGGIGNMMGNTMQGLNRPAQIPPPIPVDNYFVVINNVQSGPYNLDQIRQMISNGQATKESLVWKQGTAQVWVLAETVKEIADLFNLLPPPIPGV